MQAHSRRCPRPACWTPRPGLGTPKAPIPAAGTITTTIVGAGGVPASGVSAVVLNVTAKNATAAGALKVYTAGTFKPPGAYLTFAPGTILSELAVVAPSAAGAVSVTSTSTGTVNVTADVLGYVLRRHLRARRRRARRP